MTNIVKIPHIHAELIKAWADGALIQRYSITLQQWCDCESNMIDWSPFTKYRIKPEPKPDVVLYAMITKEKDPFDNGVRIFSVRANEQLLSTDTCMFVFDGETSALKSAQVLARV